MSKYLIINADDFGISNSVNNAIISLLNEKRISSASLMPNVKYYEEAVIWSKKNSDNIGLHLNLVNDNSKLKHRSISRRKSLEDEQGYLFENIQFFRKSARIKDLKDEISLQFKQLIDSGIKISHVDIHRYSIYPTYNPFVYIYLLKQCKRHNNVPIRWCRNGNYFIGNGIPNLCDSDNAAKFFAAVSDFYNIPIPDYVFKFPYRNTFIHYEEKKAAFVDMIYNLPEGISEVHIHPAIETDELKNTNPTWRERVFEYKLMFDNDVIEAINLAGVKIITYKDIVKIKASSSKIKPLYDILYYGIKYLIKSISKIG